MSELDPNGLDPHAPGAKLDVGKLRPWLMLAGFANALAAVADVTTKGAAKYTDDGWAQVDNGQARYMEAFARHLLDLGKGEVFDDGLKGTGCRHKAQMIWNLLASLELELRSDASYNLKALVDRELTQRREEWKAQKMAQEKVRAKSFDRMAQGNHVLETLAAKDRATAAAKKALEQ